MGKTLKDYYHKNIKKEMKIAFIATFILGMLVHGYKFTNTLLNHDSLYNGYSSQNVVGSGRWFLTIACGFSSYFDLPWINGIFSITLISLTVVVIIVLFKLENPILIVIIGGVVVTFPGITETLFFGFTSEMMAQKMEHGKLFKKQLKKMKMCGELVFPEILGKKLRCLPVCFMQREIVVC